jgi:hypothetical protein
MKYDVVFRYSANDDAEDGGGWQRESFHCEAEAKAFADGLTYGDEPQYEVDAIEECRFS